MSVPNSAQMRRSLGPGLKRQRAPVAEVVELLGQAGGKDPERAGVAEQLAAEREHPDRAAKGAPGDEAAEWAGPVRHGDLPVLSPEARRSFLEVMREREWSDPR